jgi:hypothetical protein
VRREDWNFLSTRLLEKNEGKKEGKKRERERKKRGGIKARMFHSKGDRS